MSIRCGNPEHYHGILDEDHPDYQAFADDHPQHHHSVHEVRRCFESEDCLPSVEDKQEAADAAIEAYEYYRAYPEAHSPRLPNHYYL